MDGEQLDAIRLALGVIVLLAACYFVVPEDEPKVARGRDLEKEHTLGAHRHTPAWGCKSCEAKR